MPIVEIIAPIFLTALVGFIYGRIAEPKLKSLNQLTLYLLIPALVFTSLLETEVSGREVGQVALFSLLLTGSITLLGIIILRFLNIDREQSNAVLLTSVFMNTGNYGLPVVLYAVGQAGFARAVIFVITQTFLVYSLGVYFAAAGKLDARRALEAIVKLPVLYAAVLAVVFKALHVAVPAALLDPLATMGEAGLVLMLLSLGMQLAHVDLHLAVAPISLATAIRLVASPLIAVFLVRLLQMGTVTSQAMILEAAMPTAVITSLLAVEFGSAPTLVSSTVFFTTALSFVSVTIVLSVLF